MYCTAASQMDGPHDKRGFVGAILDAVYYPTTQAVPLSPLSSFVIYIHSRSA